MRKEPEARLTGFCLEAWCLKAGVDPHEAYQACRKAMEELAREGYYGQDALVGRTKDVLWRKKKWRVFFGPLSRQGQLYWAVPLPFKGWREGERMVPPMI